MITEDDLRRLLADAAESVPPPGRAPDALLAAVTEQSTVRPARRRPPRRVLAVAAAAVLVVALGATFLRAQTSDQERTTFQETGAAIGGSSDGGDEAVEPFSEVPQDGYSYQSQATSADGDGGTNAAPVDGSRTRPSTAVVGAPTDSARVVKTGSLDLEVVEGAFDGTMRRITSQAVGLGGYVSESTTSEGGDAPSGSIIVRVPDESFDQLLLDLRELGEVTAVSSKGTDVTAQFTDLAARLTALQATRDRLGTVLSEAQNVPDILAVQDRITQVQTEIEVLRGQQRLLEDQASMGTLSVTVAEPGAEVVRIDATPDEGLGSAWDEARQRFGDGVEGLVSWSGSAAVVLIVGVLLLLLSRLTWVGVRRRLV